MGRILIPKLREIPVASTNSIIVTDNTVGFYGNSLGEFYLNKISSTEYRKDSVSFTYDYIYCPVYVTDFLRNVSAVSIILENGTWYYRYWYTDLCYTGDLAPIDMFSVTQVTNGFIPIDGWLQNGNPYPFNITALSGKISIKNRNLVVYGSNTTPFNADGKYLLQNDLINGREWYFKPSGAVPMMRIVFVSLGRWAIQYNLNNWLTLAASINAANNPWEATWPNNIQFSFSNGKASLFKSNIVLAPSLEITPLGIGYNVNSVNSTSSGMPQNISYFGNPLDQTGYISNNLTNTNHYWKFTIANGYKIYFALDTGDGYSPSNIDSSIAIRSGSTWVESNILSQQNFGQNQQGQYVLSSAQPYSAGTYSLRITNLTATNVSYRIRFIITAA